MLIEVLLSNQYVQVTYQTNKPC